MKDNTIIILTPGFPKDESDSTCLPFLQIFLLELVKNKSAHIIVITEQYPAAENYTWNGINVITLHKREPLLFYKLMRYQRLKKTLRELHSNHKPDAIHNFWFTRSALIAGNFALKHKIRHLVTFSGQDALKTNKVLTKLFLYKGLVFCFSLFQQEKILQNTNIRAEIIDLGIEPIEAGPAKKEIDLIFCGWISKLKNYSQFIEIIEAVNKVRKLNKVVICGGGDDMWVLIEKIRSLNLQHLIDVKGETPRGEVLSLMQKSKILVHTSEYESFGLVLVEGLAAGCHVISKPVGIAYQDPDIITCSTTREFIEQVIFCLENENKKNNSTNYPISKMADRYFQIYKG